MYSHPATRQDDWVFENVTGRFFVEVGAYDGVKHSNTLWLEQHGWHGTLIEADQDLYRRCLRNRPDAKCIHAAVSDGVYKEVFLQNGLWSGIERTLDPACRDIVKRYGAVRTELVTKTLDQLIGVPIVDYLSVDTEGNEYDIVSAWFKAGGRCRALTVEFNYDNQKRVAFELLCEEFNMYLAAIRGFDLCFLHC